MEDMMPSHKCLVIRAYMICARNGTLALAVAEMFPAVDPPAFRSVTLFQTCSGPSLRLLRCS